jgi:SOS response associated peptidase (SRAP)
LTIGAEERIYTYTIITTNSAKSVSFLHDRMPVILEPGSVELKRWLDPNEGWSMELANILKPYEGELLWYTFYYDTDGSYPVKKDVGKVGEDSPLFVVPLDSAENKSNIANFFAKSSPANQKAENKIIEKEAVDRDAGEDLNSETHAPVKRKLDVDLTLEDRSPSEKRKQEAPEITGMLPVKTAQRKPTKRAPPPVKKSPVKKGTTSKITSFFGTK